MQLKLNRQPSAAELHAFHEWITNVAVANMIYKIYYVAEIDQIKARRNISAKHDVARTTYARISLGDFLWLAKRFEQNVACLLEMTNFRMENEQQICSNLCSVRAHVADKFHSICRKNPNTHKV